MRSGKSVSGCAGIVMIVTSPDKLVVLVTDPLVESLGGAVELAALALVPTNVFPGN